MSDRIDGDNIRGGNGLDHTGSTKAESSLNFTLGLENIGKY